MDKERIKAILNEKYSGHEVSAGVIIDIIIEAQELSIKPDIDEIEQNKQIEDKTE